MDLRLSFHQFPPLQIVPCVTDEHLTILSFFRKKNLNSDNN